jgi:hypothetical protein
MGSDGGPLADPIAEGARIAREAAERGLRLRILGGVAVALLCPSARRPPLRRDYADIDLATTGSERGSVVRLMTALGYEANREFNMLHGHRRLIFWDTEHERHADVFVDEAHLCHRIDFRRRLELAPDTLPLADLTVFKLQVVETNEKDYLDICALFADHDLTADESGINSRYIASLTSSDWGLWRTLGMVAERSERFALELADFEAGELAAARLRQLRREVDAAPKSRGWKLRSRVGDRMRWYELPEEVH